MFLNLKSYLFIMIGITLLGISLGVVLGAYLKNNMEYFIYFSSSMVYGNFKEDQVDEDSICEPIGIYGNLKLAGERVQNLFGHRYASSKYHLMS